MNAALTPEEEYKLKERLYEKFLRDCAPILPSERSDFVDAALYVFYSFSRAALASAAERAAQERELAVAGAYAAAAYTTAFNRCWKEVKSNESRAIAAAIAEKDTEITVLREACKKVLTCGLDGKVRELVIAALAPTGGEKEGAE